MLDYKIIGARIIDGTGNPWRLEDVGIKSGRIVSVGIVRERARKRLDGRGLILCPGFVDVHTHSDGLLNRPSADNFLRQGVTTVISGNCGNSALSVREMLNMVEAVHPSINYATLIGHGSVRKKIMGMADRKPTAREMADMRGLIEKAMKEGAVGISSGLFYIPGAYAGTEELIKASKPVAAYNGLYVTHARSAGGKLPQAIMETAEISLRANISAQVSHLKVLHRRTRTSRTRAKDILSLITRLRNEGADLTYDLHPYPATNTSLSSVILPPWVSSDGLCVQRLENRAFRRKIRNNVMGNIAWIGGPGRIQVVSFPPDPSIEGLNLTDIARKLRRSISETAMGLVRDGNASCIFHALRESDVQRFITGDCGMIASDGGVIQDNKKLVHPRNYGTFPRVLREYVRENSWMTLETAIRKMSSMPAIRFRLPQRGLIVPGYYADLVLLDDTAVSDRSTFDAPHAYSEGIHYVIVNGVVAWQTGSDKITRGCGMVIR